MRVREDARADAVRELKIGRASAGVGVKDTLLALGGVGGVESGVGRAEGRILEVGGEGWGGQFGGVWLSEGPGAA